MGSVNASLKVEEVYLSVAYTKTIENKSTLRVQLRGKGLIRRGEKHFNTGSTDRDPTESIERSEHSFANNDFDECANTRATILFGRTSGFNIGFRGDDRMNCGEMYVNLNTGYSRAFGSGNDYRTPNRVAVSRRFAEIIHGYKDNEGVRWTPTSQTKHCAPVINEF